MTSTDRCACKHTGFFHNIGRPRSCRAYVNGAAGLVPCGCKGFREPNTESEVPTSRSPQHEEPEAGGRPSSGVGRAGDLGAPVPGVPR